MDEEQSLDGELSQAIFTAMVRAGVLPAKIVEDVMDDFAAEAETTGIVGREERASLLSRMALEILMAEHGQSAADWHAERRRRDIRVRSNIVALKPDGGNDRTG